MNTIILLFQNTRLSEIVSISIYIDHRPEQRSQLLVQGGRSHCLSCLELKYMALYHYIRFRAMTYHNMTVF